MERSAKVRKQVFKHIMCNPFSSSWNEIPPENALSFSNLFRNEVMNKCTNSNARFLPSPSKRLKTEESDPVSFCKSNLILGINNILSNIDKVEYVILLKTTETENLIEPLMMLCREKQIKYVSMSYDALKENMRDLTGVKRLAAFAIPKIHTLALAVGYLDQFNPASSSKGYYKMNIKKVPIS